MLVCKTGHAHAVPQHGGIRLELNHLAEKAGIALLHLKSWGDLDQGTSHVLKEQLFSNIFSCSSSQSLSSRAGFISPYPCFRRLPMTGYSTVIKPACFTGREANAF